MPDDDLIVALRAARDAVMTDAPPAPYLAEPATGAPRGSWIRSRRLGAAIAAAAVVVLAAAGLVALDHRGSGRDGSAASPTRSSLDDPYNYKSVTRSYKTGAHMRTETWFPVSGLGPYLTRVTMTGPDKWADVTTPDGTGVYVFRSTCDAPRPPIPIKGAPYSRLECPLGEKTPIHYAPGSAKLGSWVAPTPKYLATLSSDPAELRRQLRAAIVAEMGGRATADQVARSEMINIPDLLTLGGYLSRGLSAAFRDVIASLPGVHVSSNAKNLDGDVGTEYLFVNRLSGGPGYADGRPFAEPRLIFDRHGMYIGTGYSPDLVTGKDRYPEYGVTSYAGGTAATAGGTPHLNG